MRGGRGGGEEAGGGEDCKDGGSGAEPRARLGSRPVGLRWGAALVCVCD